MLRRSLFLSLLLVAALLVGVVTPASAEKQGSQAASSTATYSTAALPKMWCGDAKSYARQTLKWRFRAAYRHGMGKRIRCAERLSRTKMRLKVRWGIGDSSYRGSVTPFYSYRGSDPWYAHYNVLRTNEYCLATGGSRDRCTKRYKGTY